MAKSTLAISTARQPSQDNRCRPSVLSLPLLYGSAMKFRYAVAGMAVALVLICIQRSGAVAHSACLGGLAMGWLYAHLLGFGRPSFLQRFLTRRRAVAERFRRMDAEQFIAEEIDPLLEKISRAGVASLTRAERRILAQAREKILEAQRR